MNGLLAKVKVILNLLFQSFLIVWLLASVSTAQADAEALSSFSDKFICNMATIKKGNEVSWSMDPSFSGYLSEANKRGLNCLINNNNKLIGSSSAKVRKAFTQLSDNKRKIVQQNLKAEGFYLSDVDGLYGKGTFSALVKYNIDYFDGADLRADANVNQLINDLLKTHSVAFNQADDIKEKQDELQNSKYLLESSFKRQTLNERKQLQYALKKLGIYDSRVDGVWGPKTAKAFENFELWQEAGVANPEALFAGIKGLVTVPDTFSTSKSVPVAKRQEAAPRQKYQPDYPTPKAASSKQVQLNDTGKELLRIGLIGIACSLTPNPAACLEGASGSSRSSSSHSTSSSRPTTIINNSGCSSDFQCSMGEKCIKKPYSNNGVCMKTVNRYGGQTYSAPSASSVRPRMGGKQCRFLTDCPIGFQCDMTYNVCVK